jgi:hypothetical protein
VATTAVAHFRFCVGSQLLLTVGGWQLGLVVDDWLLRLAVFEARALCHRFL